MTEGTKTCFSAPTKAWHSLYPTLRIPDAFYSPLASAQLPAEVKYPRQRTAHSLPYNTKQLKLNKLKFHSSTAGDVFRYWGKYNLLFFNPIQIKIKTLLCNALISKPQKRQKQNKTETNKQTNKKTKSLQPSL